MSKTRLFISGAILPLVLIMGACSDKNKGDAVEFPTLKVANLTVDDVDAKAVESLLTVDKRTVTADEAELALEKMGFNTSEQGAFSWDKKSGKAGNYTYKNLSGTGKDGEEIKIASLELTGVHMVGDNPNFDRIDVRDMNVTDEDMLVTVDRLSLSRPSPEFGASVLEVLETLETAQNLKALRRLHDLDLNINLDGEDLQFGAMLADNLSVTSDDGVAKFGSVGWGEDETTKKGLFLLEDFDFKGTARNGKPSAHMTLKSISATGLDMESLRARGKDSGPKSLFSPYEKGFEGFALKKFTMKMDTLELTAPLITSQAKKSGGDVVVRQSLEPMTISFSEAPKDKGMMEAWSFLQSAGYDALEFSGGSTTVMNESTDTVEVKDSFLSLKDGFDLRFSFKGQGLKEASEQAKLQSENINTDDLLDSVSLSSLNLSLTDKSIVDRAFKVAAEQQGQKPGDLKKLAKGALMVAGFSMSMQADTEEKGDILTEAVSALGDFIEDGGSLEMSLNPPEPLPAGYLSKLNPQTADPVKLGLRIQHKN